MKSGPSAHRAKSRRTFEMNHKGALRVGLNCGLRSAKLRSWRCPPKRGSFAGNTGRAMREQGLAAPISRCMVPDAELEGADTPMVLMRLIHNAQTAPDRAGGFVVMGVVADWD